MGDKNTSRRKAVGLLVAVAVIAAILAGVLVPRQRKRGTVAPGVAGSVTIVDKAPMPTTTAPGIDIGSIAAALVEGSKQLQQAPAMANASTAAPSSSSGAAAAPSPTPAAKDSAAGGFFSNLLGGASQDAAAAPANPAAPLVNGWKALEGSGATQVCRPRNGTELVQMVTRSPCTVVVLQPSVTYNVTKVMNVTTTKIVVGNPVFLPTLRPAKGVVRLFDVYAGGRLDLRAMQLYRGDPERYDEKTLRVFQGSAVRVHLGGDFSASWCIFTQPEQTIQAFLSDLDNPRNRIRTIGGFVLVLGGTLRLIGCIMYRFQPYGLAIVNNMNIGRDVLVVAGNAVLAGWYACMGNLMTASINVGTGAAVLGGTMTLAGGAVVNGGVLNAHWGTGQLCFVGGGTLVTVGFHNVGAFTAIMRAGAGQFGTGAGALIHIGHLQPRAWGVASVFNAGQTHFCGAGLLHKHGENIATTAINHFFAGAGAHFYLGSGDSTWVGVSAGRSTVAQSLSGLGGIYYVGAGTTNHIGLPAAGFAVVRTRFMLGGELFTGGGSVNWINCKRYGAQVVDAWFGLGTNVFNGGGGVVFVNTKTKTVRRKYFPFPKNPGAIWVGGTKVGGAASNNDIFASGIGGVRPLGGAHNKTRYFMGRNRRVQMLQRRRLQQQDPVTPTVVAVGEASPEATRNSLLLVQSSIEEEVREGLVGPEQLVAALHGMETIGELLARLDDDTAVPTGPTQVAVSEDTQCLVCGAAPVEQVGRGACQVSDACTAAEPAEALLQAQTAAAAGGVALPASVATTTDLLGTLGGVDAAKDGEALPDLFYMWHELAVYCTAGAGGGIADCVSEAGLKQAVKAWLAGAVGQDSGFSVAAASTAVPAAVAHLADDALLSATHRARRSLQQADAAAATTDGCAAEGTRFNVYVTTIDAGLQKPLRTAWAALVKDPEPVRAALGGPAGPCALTAARKAAIVYPPIERMEPFQPQGLGLVGPSVIVGSGAAIAPVDHVVRGQPYRLFLQNFPGGMPAELRLVSASAAAAAGNAAAGLEGVPLATVGSFDDDGVTELAWTVAEDLPEGRYYVRAAAGPGGALFGTSQPFSIVAAPLTGAARRLRFG